MSEEQSLHCVHDYDDRLVCRLCGYAIPENLRDRIASAEVNLHGDMLSWLGFRSRRDKVEER